MQRMYKLWIGKGMMVAALAKAGSSNKKHQKQKCIVLRGERRSWHFVFQI